MHIIVLLLILSAVYSGCAYLVTYTLALRGRVAYAEAELNTFHLGICFILAIGFLGLILKGV